ncbi:MAG: L-glutamate gamma-semialdehyde dehydrogenase [Bacillota bacterium]
MAIVEFRNEPLTNFADPALRRAQEEALRRVEGELGGRYPLLIGGEEVWTEKSIVSRSPSQPDRVVGTTASAGVAEAVRALEAAEKAFASWRLTPVEFRVRILLKAAAILRRRRFEMNAWLMHEVGKPWVEADADTAEAIDFLEYYARQMLRLAGPQPITPYPGEENEFFYIPLGVGVVHSPFNFPLAILVGMTSAALVTGNTVVVKPSVHAPVIAYKFFEVLKEAGLPDGVANYLPGDPAEIGDVLTTHPLVRFINFTGSAAVGAMLYEKAARVQPGQKFLRRVIAEMGGKDAIVVAADADLDAAAEGIVTSAFGFSGQKCSACSRVIAEAPVYDEILARVAERARALRLGPATDPETQMGPVITAEARDRILRYIEIGKGEGRLVLGGQAAAGAPGYLVEPTIFADVDPGARIAQEEIFGPVVAFIKAKDFRQAIEFANSTQYGLTGGVYSRSRENLEYARREFHVGNLYFNRKITGALVGVQPFGGFNMSGTDSKAGGPDYLLLFMQGKSVAERL